MTAQPRLRLKRGRDRPRTHPWIFKGDVADAPGVAPGDPVTVVDAAGRFVGRGFYNPRPALCCRILTRRDEPLDGALIGRRLGAALAFRRALGRPLAGATAGRLVWSEADQLPGLIVDRYREVLVVQCQTLGMARWRAVVAAQLRALLGPWPVLSADDDLAAGLEGFAPERGWLDGEGPGAVEVLEADVRLRVVLGAGQKTGLYLDQADNRRRVEPLARDRVVLDAFAYTGGFACHALRAGARRAVCLESSPEAVLAARDNLALNAAADRAEVRAVNAFDELRRMERGGERFGLIALDPPPFARSRAALAAAARGYKEINLRALRLLAPGGHLLTFSCSHHLGPALLEDICREAAADARVELRVLAQLPQAADHPVTLLVPETRYLHGLLLQSLDA